MPDKPLIDRLETDLFCDQELLPAKFAANELDMVQRYRWAFTRKLDEPTLTDKKLRVKLMEKFAISEATAYRDIPIIKHLVGNIKQATKEFQRFTANHMIMNGFNLAKDAKTMIEIKQGEVMIRAALAMAKVHMLDKEDILPYAWDDIEINNYEVTDDITILPGMEKIANSNEELEALKEKLRKRFGGNFEPIQEATIVHEPKE